MARKNVGAALSANSVDPREQFAAEAAPTLFPSYLVTRSSPLHDHKQASPIFFRNSACADNSSLSAATTRRGARSDEIRVVRTAPVSFLSACSLSSARPTWPTSSPHSPNAISSANGISAGANIRRAGEDIRADVEAIPAGTRLAARQLDGFLTAVKRFLETDIEFQRLVFTTSRALLLPKWRFLSEPAESAKTAILTTKPANLAGGKDRLEKITEIATAEAAARGIGPAPGIEFMTMLPVLAELVVGLAFFRVLEHLVGLSDLLEALGRRLVARVDVRVELLRQRAEGPPDVIVGGRTIEAKDGVWVSCHDTLPAIGVI